MKIAKKLTIKKPHKFRAVPQFVDGIRFASTKEAKRYQELKLLVRAGKITDLKLQPTFELVQSLKYRADFEYYDRATGKRVVEDVKGFKTAVYKSKRKMMRKQHGIEILET